MEKKLPKNWVETDLENLFNLVYGKGLSVSELLDEGFDVYGANGIIGKYDKFTYEKSKVIISCRGAASGAIHKTKPKSFITSNSIVLDEVSDKLLNLDFVKYAMTIADKSDVITGTAQPQITIQLLKYLQFPLPPLAEQNRIVEKLDTLFAQLETIKTSMAKVPLLLKDFRQQVLTQAVTGKLTEEWRKGRELEINYIDKINKIHVAKLKPVKVRGQKSFENESFFEIPKTWNWVPVYKLVKDGGNSICAGPFGTIFKAKDFKNEGVPIIFLRHVKKEGFNQRKPVYMDEKVWVKYHQEYSVFGGELLVTKLGDPPGEATIFPNNFKVSMVTPDIMKADFNEDIFITKFAMYFFNSNIAKDIIAEVSFGMTRLRIDLTMFKSIPIPVPTIEEQQEIVSRVESLFAKADAIEKQYETLKAKIESLPQAILHKAFKGELTEQLDSDGDARELLKEIEGLMAVSGKVSKKGKSKV